MKIDRTMATTRDALQRHPVPGRPDDHLLRLLELTLRNNDFQFDDRFYLQTCGTAMGKTYAPGLANIYLEEFDDRAMNGFSLKPLLFYRYLDDIFFVWTGSRAQLKEYEKYLSSLIDGIKITLDCSRVSIPFLDTTVYKLYDADDDVLQTRVYFKPTDTHQLLDKSSFHPKHTAKGVLKSQLLRFKRISTTLDNYNTACHVLFQALAKRNYSRSMMRKMKRDIWHSNVEARADTGSKLLPIVLPFNEIGTGLAAMWKSIIRKNTLFDGFRLIAAFSVGQSLKRKLVHSRMTSSSSPTTPNSNQTYRLNPKPQGCTCCVNTKCRACNVITPGVNITSFTNSKIFRIIGSIFCKSCNIVYVVSCRKCGLQYVGETRRALADRINDHLSAIRLRKDTPISLHFNTTGHRLSHFSAMGVEQLCDDDSAIVRRMKESTWQNLLQSAYPFGINNLTKNNVC
jgi:hypothetical protein